MEVLPRIVGGALLCTCALLAACGPSEEKKALFAEKRRLDCLDKLCEGDTAPRHDTMKEFAFKLNGEWFIGPREYGGYGGSFAFFWPSKVPAKRANAERQAPEFVPSAAGQVSNFSEVAIEIFLQHHDGVMHGPSRYEHLRQAEAEGRLVSKDSPRPGLEVWRTRETDGLGPGLWYVATQYITTDPNGAVLACRDGDPRFDRCVTGFIWQPGMAADMRFRAKHATDWPEIYREAARVLQLIRKA
jgi:hypothetical protein